MPISEPHRQKEHSADIGSEEYVLNKKGLSVNTPRDLVPISEPRRPRRHPADVGSEELKTKTRRHDNNKNYTKCLSVQSINATICLSKKKREKDKLRN